MPERVGVDRRDPRRPRLTPRFERDPRQDRRRDLTFCAPRVRSFSLGSGHGPASASPPGRSRRRSARPAGGRAGRRRCSAPGARGRWRRRGRCSAGGPQGIDRVWSSAPHEGVARALVGGAEVPAAAAGGGGDGRADALAGARRICSAARWSRSRRARRGGGAAASIPPVSWRRRWRRGSRPSSVACLARRGSGHQVGRRRAERIGHPPQIEPIAAVPAQRPPDRRRPHDRRHPDRLRRRPPRRRREASRRPDLHPAPVDGRFRGPSVRAASRASRGGPGRLHRFTRRPGREEFREGRGFGTISALPSRVHDGVRLHPGRRSAVIRPRLQGMARDVRGAAGTRSWRRHGTFAGRSPSESRRTPRTPGRLGHGHSLPGPWPRRPRPSFGRQLQRPDPSAPRTRGSWVDLRLRGRNRSRGATAKSSGRRASRPAAGA